MSSPLYPPPRGLKSDWSQAGWAPTIETVCILLLVLSTLFTAARLYTRIFVLRSFGSDDCFCILAYGTATTIVGWHFVAIKYGFGRHIWNIPKANALELYKSFFLLRLLPGVAYLFIKLTLLFTYARIFRPAKYMRWLIWGGIFACTAFYTGTFFNFLFQCKPMAKSWDPSLKGTCRIESIPGAPTGIFNVITDLYICLLPIPMVWSLKMSWSRKLKLLFVFSLGFFTVSMSIVRFVETVVEGGQVDFTYQIHLTDIFAILEIFVGLMVADMLVFPALWDRVLRKPFDGYWARVSSVYRSVLSLRHERSSTRSRSDSDTNEKEIQKTLTVVQEHGVV